VTALAVLGNLSRDVVAGGPPRPGGGVFWSTPALARIGARATVTASCSAEDRPALMPPLEAFGLPVTWCESSSTTAYSFHYEGDRRIMRVDAIGDPWTPEQAVAAAGDARWIDACALTRTDFPSATLAALTEDAELLLDAHGLVRAPTLGALQTDANVGDMLSYVDILKLNDEEAETLVGSAEPHRMLDLGVPEVILTLGSMGAWVVTSTLVEHIPAIPIEEPVDPTGAGDTYSVTYLVQRAAGAEPVEAARTAAVAVSELLAMPFEGRTGPAPTA
jgi:sugar/nucleoside kinase (ribokinase family)